jgi:hypothetical protein
MHYFNSIHLVERRPLQAWRQGTPANAVYHPVGCRTIGVGENRRGGVGRLRYIQNDWNAVAVVPLMGTSRLETNDAHDAPLAFN